MQATAQERRETHALRHTGTLFLALEILGAIVVSVVLAILAGDPATECGWCEVNALDNAVRNLIAARDPIPPAKLSHVLSMGVAPLLAFGAVISGAIRSRKPRAALQDSAILIATLILTTGIASAVKCMADRQRPGFLFGRAMEIEASRVPVERFLSFFSGDTAWAYVVIATAATLAWLRGYRVALPLAVVGGLVASAVAVLRMAADMHWFTDVLTGACVGVAVGVLVPLSLHRRAADGV